MKSIVFGLLVAATIIVSSSKPAHARRYRVYTPVYPVYPTTVYYPRRVYTPVYPVYPTYPVYPVYPAAPVLYY